MAKKRNAKHDGTFNGYQFITHTLNASDKQWLEACDIAEEFPIERFLDLVAEGYKFSLSPDFNNMSIVASITDKQENSPFFKYTLSGRGSGTLDALAALGYRHFHLSEGDWSFFDQTPGDNGSRFG